MTVALTLDDLASIEFPPGWDRTAILRPLNTQSWRTNRRKRLELTYSSPLRFALTYMPHRLQHPDTGAISFIQMHMDMCVQGRRWMEPGEQLCSFVGPRGSGKTTWPYGILPAWVLGHMHSSNFLAFSYTAQQARNTHLKNLLNELRTNELLRHDFPGLIPKRGQASIDRIVLENGATLAAFGMMETSLGWQDVQGRRPRIMCHRSGTPMLLNGRWCPVDEHPSFRGDLRAETGQTVRVWGLPFDEVVTTEHRYWAKWVNGRRGKSKPAGWCTAADLDPFHYIGTPIDMTVDDPPGWVEKMQTGARKRDARGRVYGPEWKARVVVPDRFADPEFWWLVGYWWGNGSLGSPRDDGPNYATVTVAIPDKHPEYAQRLHRYITARIGISRNTRGACAAHSWSDAPLARWLRTWKEPGAGQAEKCPPFWVERLPLHLQRALVEGYVAVDGDSTNPAQVRVSSIWLPSLLMLRRIQARLGVAVTIRKGPGPRLSTFPDGRTSWSKQKYDARWSLRNERYATVRTHISDGMLWSKVRSIEASGEEKFVPIQTPDHTYVTAFGLSHNCGDDLEPAEAKNTLDEVDRNRSRLLHSVIPMGNRRAVIWVTGTTPSHDSLIHQFVHAARGRPQGDWVRRAGFVAHHYPALDENDESWWPQQWPTETLRAMRDADPYGFDLNYQNDPRPPSEQSFWTPEIFRYNPHWEASERVLHVDAAASTGPNSDYTAMVLLSRKGSAACVERVAFGRWTDPEIRDRIHEFCAPFDRHRPLVRVEAQPNRVDSLAPWPDGVRYEMVHAVDPKPVRIRRGHAQYYRRAVWHLYRPGEDAEFDAFERELCRYGRSKHDDVPDALAGALEWAFPIRN